MSQPFDRLLSSLRWQPDMLITNHFMDRVWLKECFVGSKRIGITDCCFGDDPCAWHAAISKLSNVVMIGKAHA